jgi:hypothetical protein
MYPFLYARLAAGTDNIEAYVVTVASHCDYAVVNTAWMNDPALPEDRVLRIDVDLQSEQHEFSSEADALGWIQDWWFRKALPNGRFNSELKVVDGKLSIVTNLK